MTLERCQEAQKTIQAVIKEMRKDPDTDKVWCNLLENHTNALLELLRGAVGWRTAELPNIST